MDERMLFGLIDELHLSLSRMSEFRCQKRVLNLQWPQRVLIGIDVVEGHQSTCLWEGEASAEPALCTWGKVQRGPGRGPWKVGTSPRWFNLYASYQFQGRSSTLDRCGHPVF